MNQQRIRRVVLVLAVTALVGTVAAPTAQAGAATKAGKDNPCQIEEQPKPKEPQKDTPKPAGPAADKVKAEQGKAARAKSAEAKAENKDKSTAVGVLVCGDIVKISGKHRVTALTLKTEKGPVVVQVTHDTVVFKGDVQVPLKALTVGAPVAIKAELVKNGTITARGILLL